MIDVVRFLLVFLLIVFGATSIVVIVSIEDIILQKRYSKRRTKRRMIRK